MAGLKLSNKRAWNFLKERPKIYDGKASNFHDRRAKNVS
jgi:hypothetical protein